MIQIWIMEVLLLSIPAPENLSENLFHAFMSLLGVRGLLTKWDPSWWKFWSVASSSMIMAVHIYNAPLCASVFFSRSLLKRTRVLASFNKSKGAWEPGIFRIVADSRMSHNNTTDRKLEIKNTSEWLQKLSSVASHPIVNVMMMMMMVWTSNNLLMPKLKDSLDVGNVFAQIPTEA